MGNEPGENAAPLVDLEEVYRMYAHDLRRFALYLSGDATLAEDLVADAFVRALTVRERIETATVRGYLFAIVRNLFLRHCRRQRRRLPLDAEPIDGRPGPEEHMNGESELHVVMAALAQLPELDRAAILMRADEVLPYEDIAVALGISTAAAKVKVYRSRLKLAESLHSASPTCTTSKKGEP
jgi:RNA polymerase sigma-70 factor, ECF subfamily